MKNNIKKLYNFLLFDIKVLFKSHGLAILLFAFQTISLITIPFLLEVEEINKHAPQILIFAICLSSMISNNYILSADYRSGAITQQRLSFSPIAISSIKQLSVFAISSFINTLICLGAFLLYELSMLQAFYLFSSAKCVIMLSCSLAHCSSVMKIYFSNNNEYISIIMLPLLIPVFICASAAIIHQNIFYLGLLIGINLISIPVITLLSSSLINNLEEIS